MQSAEQAAAAAASAEGQEGSLVRAPVKHVLSQELQLYFDRVAQLLRAKPGKPPWPEGGHVHVLIALAFRARSFTCQARMSKIAVTSFALLC